MGRIFKIKVELNSLCSEIQKNNQNIAILKNFERAIWHSAVDTWRFHLFLKMWLSSLSFKAGVLIFPLSRTKGSRPNQEK